MWKIFLSRFKLVRELLGLINENSPVSNDKTTASKSSLGSAYKLRKVRRD